MTEIELNPFNQEQHNILLALINQKSDKGTKLIHLHKGSCYDLDVDGQKIRYQLTHSIKSFFYDNPKQSNTLEIRFIIYNPSDILGRGTYAKVIDNVKVSKTKDAAFHIYRNTWTIKEFSEKYFKHEDIEDERKIARDTALKTKYPVVRINMGASSFTTFLMRRLGELNLQELLEDRFLSKHDRLSICLALCDMIHSQLWHNQTTPPENAIIHQDIKPENIRISFEGGQWRAYLVDFGLAIVNGDPIKQLIRAGTPIYKHPSILEKTRNISAPVDDVFSLFITMLDVLTDTKGRFDSENYSDLFMHNKDLKAGIIYPIVPVLKDIEESVSNNLKKYFTGKIDDMTHASNAIIEFRAFLKESLVNQKTPSSHPQEFLTDPLKPELLYASHPSVLAKLHQHGWKITFQDLLNAISKLNTINKLNDTGKTLWPNTLDFIIKNIITPSLDDLDKLFTLIESIIQIFTILKLCYQYHPSVFDGLTNHRSDSKLHYTHWLLSNRKEASLEELAIYLLKQTEFDAQKEKAINEAKKYLNDINLKRFIGVLGCAHPKFTSSMITIHINHPLILTCFRLFEYLPDNPDSASFLNYVENLINEKTYFDNAKLLQFGKIMLNQFTNMMITNYCTAFPLNPVASSQRAILSLLHSFRNHDLSTIPVQLTSIRDILYLIPAIQQQYQLLEIPDNYLPKAIEMLNQLSPIVKSYEIETIRTSLQKYHELMGNILFLTKDLDVGRGEPIALIIDKAVDLKDFLKDQSNNITNKEIVLRLLTLSHMLKRLAVLSINQENQQAILNFVESMHIDLTSKYESLIVMGDDELLGKIKAGLHVGGTSEALNVVYTTLESPGFFRHRTSQPNSPPDTKNMQSIGGCP